jgi:DNA-binding beta-propeller fold protein YncE
VALDSSGNIIIADTGNNQIRVVAEKTGTFYGVAMTARDIYRIAGTGQQAFGGDGGPALNAWLNSPQSVTVTPAGGILVTDSGRVRLIP